MLRVLLPVAGGILVGQWLALPAAYLWVGVVLCVGLSLVARSGLYAFSALVLMGIGVTALNRGESSPPLGKRLLMQLEAEATPRTGEGYTSTPVAIRSWCDEQGKWHLSEVRATLYCDSTLRPVVGERLTLIARLKPYGDKYPLYRALQQRRGFVGSINAGTRHLLERDTVRRLGLVERLHQGAVERLARLDLSPASEAVALAMTVGEKQQISPMLRSAYARTGTSHLLAVSGLHVGIVFFTLNMVLWGLSLAPSGHRIKNLAAIALIWLYALVAGASPSVLRAAWMFSALQIALAFTLRYNALNILFGVVAVMLLLQPDYLFDISFQLSFLAVAAILSWGQPLIRRLRGRFTKWLAGLFIIGVVSTLATAPLGAAQFGLIAPIGVVLNPVVIFVAQLVIIGSLAWMLLPWKLLTPLFSAFIDGAAKIQNGVILRAAEWEYAAFESQPAAGIVTLIYLLFVALTLLAWSVEQKAENKPKIEL